jgi:hypothetical protein
MEPIQEYRDGLNRLREFNFNNYTAEEIKIIIDKFLGIYPATYGIYSPEKFNDFLLYRVRMNIDTKKEDTNLIHTFSYPPPNICTKNGRANLKGKSVFYCSNCSGTAIMESKPQVGDIGYLSIWQGNSNRDMRASILLPQELKQENVWNIVAQDSYNYLLKHNSQIEPEMAERYKLALKFISDLFLQENEPYNVTSIFANEMLYSELNFDYIIYSSVVNQSYSCNLALHPNIVQNYLLFHKVIKFRVNDIQDNKYNLSIGNVGEITGSKIKWRKPNKEEENIFDLPMSI